MAEEKQKITKNLNDKVYELLELAQSTGKLKKGTNEVTKTIERNIAKLVIIAEDVTPTAIVAHLPPLCDEKKIPHVKIPSKKELGGSVGLKVSCASAAIVNEGEGRNLLNEITNILTVKKKSEKGEK